MCFILDKYDFDFHNMSLLTWTRTCSMTFGHPPAIPNSYILQELPLDVELKSLDESNSQSPALVLQQMHPSHSTAVIYIESMYVRSAREAT